MQLKQELKPEPPSPAADSHPQPKHDLSQQSDQNSQYYQEYKLIYHNAFELRKKLESIDMLREQAGKKLNKIQKQIGRFVEGTEEGKKRLRRSVQQIDRKFVCQVARCHRCYGSEISLQQHTKLKHPQLHPPQSYKRQGQPQF